MEPGSVRFLHTSDWQLGMTRHFLEGEAQSRYAGARLDAVRGIGQTAREHRCDFVVVAGDVFDSNFLASQTLRRSLDALRTIEVPVYLLPGNHDAHNAATIYRSEIFLRERPEHVHVLDHVGPYPVAPGVELLAAPLTSNAPISDPTTKALEAAQPDGVRRILVAHGQVDAINPDRRDVSAIRLAALEQALSEGSIHYVALGDRHSRLSVGATGMVHYSGTPEVTDFREQLPGDVLLVELSPQGTGQVEEIHVGRWAFQDLAREVNGSDDLDDLDSELSGLPDADRTVVRYALTGTLSLSEHARLQDLLARHTDRLAGCYAWERHAHLAVYVDGTELTDIGVGGFVTAAVNELAAQAETQGAEAAVAGDALALLYRLAKAGER
ncbi:metallophosphoesterase family protein [Austwickia chelonae]|uniref:metallophosphoesterase family protein n=1 Tax=Austwickia chelonae TaxID=100225 RepID=UPI000E2568B6|nr:metallophosphoesterase [Austwickia chelonae]